MAPKYRILFLNPPDPSLVHVDAHIGYDYFEPPLGLLYVYDFIKRLGGTDVKFIDLNIEMKFISKGRSLEDILRSNIENYQPDLIAISALYYSSISVFHLMAKKIKNINPKVVVAFGGHYPSHLTEQCLSDKNVNYAILSEGELGMSDLIDFLRGEKDIRDTEGLAYKKEGVLIKNKRSTFWEGYSDVKRLPWEDTYFQYYFKEGRNLLYRLKHKSEFRIASITASRGCPNNCTFCGSASFWNRRWRRRKIANIIDEINYLKSHYHINTVVFNDENISVNKKWFIELLDELKKVNISWLSGGGFSVRTLNDETVIKKMYESGIIFFNLAVESGLDKTLKKINKQLTVAESKNVVRLIRENGDVFINAFIMSGFPFETLSDIKKTYEFAETLDTDWKGFYCVNPLPGTELYNECKKDNLIEVATYEHYGEFYYASSKVKYIDYTGEHLNHLNYLANLKNNFVQNRNLRLKTIKSLEQAERDFLYILEMAPNHVFAYLGLAEIMKLRKNVPAQKMYILKAKKILEEDSFNWADYLNELNVDVDKLYKEVQITGSAVLT